MKRIFHLLLALCICGCNESPKIDITSNHDWSEPADPIDMDMESWRNISAPIVTFGSVDIRYQRSQPYSGTLARDLKLSGWRGERVHAQIVVSTNRKIGDLWCDIEDFKSSTNERLKEIAKCRFVKYVLSSTPCDTISNRTTPNESVDIQPDILDESPYITLHAKTSRPIWVTIDIPQDAKAGEYTTNINLRGDKFSESLSLTLNVIDRVLPPIAEGDFPLDLWQHPNAIARIESVEPWSAEHYQAMIPIMSKLARSGQKVITTILNKDPWNNLTYDTFGDMIIWNKYPDGSWEYDFSIFDQWVESMMDLGIDQMINCYSMLPWNNIIHYRDVTTDKFVNVYVEPGSKNYVDMWGSFLFEFENHLSKKEWLEITNIAIDNRSLKYVQEAMSVKSKYAPSLGVTLAYNKFAVDEYSSIKQMRDDTTQTDNISRAYTTTYWASDFSAFPNIYISSNLAEAVYLGWYAAANDYDGFLRCPYNAWPKDPIRDSRFTYSTSGNTFLIYPDAYSSIRFERLREGVQDWQKIMILKNEYKNNPEKLKIINDALSVFKSGKPFNSWDSTLNDAKTTLNQI